MEEFTPAQAALRAKLHYDPETGVFTWAAPGPGRRVGRRLYPHANGYVMVFHEGRLARAHRLAFLYMTGELPPEGMEVDHINGDKADNRWTNLRAVSRKANRQNHRRARADSTTGFLGVSPSGSRFTAQIGHAGANRYLGTFDTPEEAHQAYVAAKRDLHEGCTI